MSTPQSDGVFASFSLDAKDLTKSAINTVRATLGISGAVALIFGLLITFWPKNSAVVITILFGIYFIIAGLAYLGLGIFSKGISGGEGARHHPRRPLRHRRRDRAREPQRVRRDPRAVPWPLRRHPVDRRGHRRARAVGRLRLEGLGDLLRHPERRGRHRAAVLAALGRVVLFIFAGVALIVLGIVQIVRAFTFGKGVTA